MPVFRALLLLFSIAVCACVVLYFVTGDRRYLRWSGLMFKLVVAAGLLFLAVLLIERLA